MNKLRAIGMVLMLAMLAMLSLLTACEREPTTISKSLYVFNNADITVVSVLLDVKDKPLKEPIELLDAPLGPKDYVETFVILPEKQAKEEYWTTYVVTEEGEANSKRFAVGGLYPDDEDTVQGYEIRWIETDDSGYGTAVYFIPLDEFLAYE